MLSVIRCELWSRTVSNTPQNRSSLAHFVVLPDAHRSKQLVLSIPCSMQRPVPCMSSRQPDLLSPAVGACLHVCLPHSVLDGSSVCSSEPRTHRHKRKKLKAIHRSRPERRLAAAGTGKSASLNPESPNVLAHSFLVFRFSRASSTSPTFSPFDLVLDSVQFKEEQQESGAFLFCSPREQAEKGPVFSPEAARRPCSPFASRCAPRPACSRNYQQLLRSTDPGN